MVGTFADVVIADAIVKRVAGFDLMMAKDALLKDVGDFVLFSPCTDLLRPQGLRGAPEVLGRRGGQGGAQGIY